MDRAKADAWSRCAGRVAASTTRYRLHINAELAARLRAAGRAGHLDLNKSQRRGRGAGLRPAAGDGKQLTVVCPTRTGRLTGAQDANFATSVLRVLPRPAELSLPAPSWADGAPLSRHCVMAIRPRLTQLGTDKARLLPREMGQCDQTAPTATKEPITRRSIDDEIDDNDDDSQASQLPSLHLDSRHILAAQRVRPCLRIRRLGVRIPSGARSSG